MADLAPADWAEDRGPAASADRDPANRSVRAALRPQRYEILVSSEASCDSNDRRPIPFQRVPAGCTAAGTKCVALQHPTSSGSDTGRAPMPVRRKPPLRLRVTKKSATRWWWGEVQPLSAHGSGRHRAVHRERWSLANERSSPTGGQQVSGHTRTKFCSRFSSTRLQYLKEADSDVGMRRTTDRSSSRTGIHGTVINPTYLLQYSARSLEREFHSAHLMFVRCGFLPSGSCTQRQASPGRQQPGLVLQGARHLTRVTRVRPASAAGRSMFQTPSLSARA
jgi:hypothetical protein